MTGTCVAAVLVDKMAMIREARVSLSTFIGGCLIALMPIAVKFSYTTRNLFNHFGLALILIYCALFNVILITIYSKAEEKPYFYKVGSL